RDTLNVGTIFIQSNTTTLSTVVLQGRTPPSVQKGDTSEFRANAFKTNPDASAEELLQKMPGVTLDNGSIKVQGENVGKVFIDGKPYFGDDPAAALKNL